MLNAIKPKGRNSKGKFPSSVNIIIINLLLLSKTLRIYATLNIGRHLLLLSTLFNNYKVINLINNRSLLKPNTFIKASKKESIKVKILSLLIISHST